MDTPSVLREICGHDSRSIESCVHCEAAEEIERLQTENHRLREFAKQIERQKGEPYFARLAASALKPNVIRRSGGTE